MITLIMTSLLKTGLLKTSRIETSSAVKDSLSSPRRLDLALVASGLAASMVVGLQPAFAASYKPEKSAKLAKPAKLEKLLKAQPPLTREVKSENELLSVDELKVRANEAFWKHDFIHAKETLNTLLCRTLDQPERARVLTNLAICQAQLEDWTGARENSASALKLAATKSLTEADAEMIEARCLLLNGKEEAAKALYQKAIATITELHGSWNADLAPYFEGLAGCYMHEKNYKDAECYYRKVAQLDLLKYGPDSPQMAWSLLSILSTQSRMHNHEMVHKLYKKIVWNFRHYNENTITAECPEVFDKAEFAKNLREQMYGEADAYKNKDLTVDYIKEGMPEEVFDNLKSRPKEFDDWYIERIGRDRSPGHAYFDPTTPMKGLIVTVHGLGLHGGAFGPFGRQIAKAGYPVVSFDIRGFGTYRNDEVFQQLNIGESMGDIKRFLREMRLDYPTKPIILLGESMGGAIVLRIASESPELVDAVISSVPSGSRYQGKRTSVLVGLKYLKHRHKQFDIGTKILTRATESEEVRDMWEGDPSVRLKLSPTELLNFSNFMSDNVKSAQKITSTPVIIFQGYSDNLVKPMGTLAIYQAIPTKDKDMVFLGRAGHLIFEGESEFDKNLTKTISDWIGRHASKPKAVSATQSLK